MPTSDHHNINTIVSVITALRPKSALDLGCGFGKYGLLMREYLDVWQERLDRRDWTINLEAIEGCERYKSPVLDHVYNKVHYGDACSVLPQMGRFDLILIADVIEHFEKAVARSLIVECFKHTGVVIVSTPVDFFPQGASFGNEYERHRCVFTSADFPTQVYVRTIRMMGNIFVASTEPLPAGVFDVTNGTGYVYLRSRMKLGNFGLPLSLGLRALCRLLA
jgi:SAM-dependent methyltransferase